MKYYPKSIMSNDMIINLCPEKDGSLYRIGYTGLFSLCYQIWKINKKCRKYKYTIQLSIPLPIEDK